MSSLWQVRRYTPWEIEPIAQRFLSQYWDASEGWVDIEAIIERDLGILIDYTRVDSLLAIGSIGRRTHDGNYVIVVKEELADRNPNRYRFTLAQEASHFLLHKEILQTIRTIDDVLDFQRSLGQEDYEHVEGDANRCAGAILMPQESFRTAAHEFYRIWFSRITTRVGAVPPEDLLKRVVDDLAKFFRVSAQAATIRLKSWPIKLQEDILESARRSQPSIASGLA